MWRPSINVRQILHLLQNQRIRPPAMQLSRLMMCTVVLSRSSPLLTLSYCTNYQHQQLHHCPSMKKSKVSNLVRKVNTIT